MNVVLPWQKWQRAVVQIFWWIIITNVDMLESGSDLDSEERGREGTGLDLVRYTQKYGNSKVAHIHLAVDWEVYGGSFKCK